jgi:hypothetical protein
MLNLINSQDSEEREPDLSDIATQLRAKVRIGEKGNRRLVVLLVWKTHVSKFKLRWLNQIKSVAESS